MLALKPMRTYPDEMVTGPQIRAARGLLSWSQADLARAARISRETVVGFETGRSVPLLTTVEQMVRALEGAGVELIDAGQVSSQGRGVGVRLRK